MGSLMRCECSAGDPTLGRFVCYSSGMMKPLVGRVGLLRFSTEEPLLCGTGGIVGGARPDPELLERMARCMAHRGTDGRRVWSDDRAGLAFGRLSVIDLDEEPEWVAPIGDVLLEQSARVRGLVDVRIFESDVRASRWRDPDRIWRALNFELWLRAFELGQPPQPAETVLG